VSTVIPVVLGALDLEDPDVRAARDASAALVQQIVDAAHRDGSLPSDVAFGDVGTILVRLSRPLPGRIPPDVDVELAHRHLDLFLAGMRAAGDGKLPGGAGLERADLRAWRGSGPGAAGDA
jgi:hypothetical protein